MRRIRTGVSEQEGGRASGGGGGGWKDKEMEQK